MKYVIKTCSHKNVCKMIKYERFMIEVLDICNGLYSGLMGNKIHEIWTGNVNWSFFGADFFWEIKCLLFKVFFMDGVWVILLDSATSANLLHVLLDSKFLCFFRLSIYLSVHLPVCQSVCPSAYPSVR